MQLKKGHSLSINTNIKNDKLRGELAILMEEFNIERQKIQDYYIKEIEKIERRKDAQK